jgi:foldase protein PrsA
MKKKILILCSILLLLSGCGNVKLEYSKDAIVTFDKGEEITAEDLYKVLKTNYGSNYLINMIDTYLLDKEFEVTSDETSYINQVVESVKNSAASYNMEFLTYISSYYGINTEKDFEEYIRLNYRRNSYGLVYAKEQVTDKQIEEYYEKYAIGDIEARHILITPNTTSSMTTEEKKAAEDKALETAKSIIKKLDEGEKFESLAKEYSEDDSNKSDGGYLGFFNRGEMEDAFEDAAVELKVGEYSKTPVKTSYGYHIILKVSQKDKPSLKNAKADIIETIAKEALQSDETLYSKAILALREKYKMKIKDSELKEGYEDMITSSNEN